MTEREKFISIVDNDILPISDAIILLEGDGYNRYQHASLLYLAKKARTIVFSGNITDYAYGSIPYKMILPKMLKYNVEEKDIIFENKSTNTRQQAEEVVRMACLKKWTRIILVASPEHQYRAYLTFLKVAKESFADLEIYNSPAKYLTWFSDEGWGVRFDRLEQEFIRIEKYTQLGHLATCEEAIEYQKWKESRQVQQNK